MDPNLRIPPHHRPQEALGQGAPSPQPARLRSTAKEGRGVMAGVEAVRRVRLGRRRGLGVLVAGVTGFTAGCGASAQAGPVGAPSAPSAPGAGATPLTLKNEEGQVTVEVTWAGTSPGVGSVMFEVVLDTHSVDLDRYDLRDLAVLRTDTGIEARPTEWRAPKGGHHRKGALTFPAAVEGRPVLGPEARQIELVIRDIAGVPERRFTWSR
jgi:hypothetical protein